MSNEVEELRAALHAANTAREAAEDAQREIIAHSYKRAVQLEAERDAIHARAETAEARLREVERVIEQRLLLPSGAAIFRTRAEFLARAYVSEAAITASEARVAELERTLAANPMSLANENIGRAQLILKLETENVILRERVSAVAVRLTALLEGFLVGESDCLDCAGERLDHEYDEPIVTRFEHKPNCDLAACLALLAAPASAATGVTADGGWMEKNLNRKWAHQVEPDDHRPCFTEPGDDDAD